MLVYAFDFPTCNAWENSYCSIYYQNMEKDASYSLLFISEINDI